MDMNRETTGFTSSDTLVVVDRGRRRRMAIIAGVGLVVVALLAAFFLMRGGESQQGGPGAAQGTQAPTVTVVVPGRSNVARVVTASGPLAAKRDQPVGIAGQGGRVERVLVDAGSWVRQGQVLAVVDRSVQAQQAAQLARLF